LQKEKTSKRELTYVQAIQESLSIAMEQDPAVIFYGLGADDPKRIFGTTENLQERFGADRVFDMPASENAMTGVAIGAALNGIRPVMAHQRLDFFLLAMDQLVNNAAKWHYMFGGKSSVPITIRLIIGQGWGQGPTHSQNLYAWFTHVPGIKVVMPTGPYDAKGLLLSAVFDPNPVIFLEHRWVHNLKGEVPEGDYRVPIGKAKRLSSGRDLTIVSTSYLTIEALHAVEHLEHYEVKCDLIDLRSLKPIDWEMIFGSVKNTGRLLVMDSGHLTGSIAGEIIARVSTEMFPSLKQAPQRITLPDFPSPTSFSLTEKYYPRSEDIVACIESMLGKNLDSEEIPAKRKIPHDVPGDWFKGPF